MVGTKITLSKLPQGQQGLYRLMIVSPTALWPLSLLLDGYTTCYTHDELTRYFEINSISFHLIFLRKADGCWSLVSMRHIINNFANVYPYIAYSCGVAIHIIISWILGSGPRWYRKWHSHVIQEQGIIIPELISLPFLFEAFKYLFKKMFSDKFSLRAFIFPHAKFLKTRNRHLLWLQTKLCLILTTPWLPVYKTFLLQHIFVYDRQCIIIMLIHTYVVYDSRRTLFDFWEQR